MPPSLISTYREKSQEVILLRTDALMINMVEYHQRVLKPEQNEVELHEAKPLPMTSSLCYCIQDGQNSPNDEEEEEMLGHATRQAASAFAASLIHEEQGKTSHFSDKEPPAPAPPPPPSQRPRSASPFPHRHQQKKLLHNMSMPTVIVQTIDCSPSTHRKHAGKKKSRKKTARSQSLCVSRDQGPLLPQPRIQVTQFISTGPPSLPIVGPPPLIVQQPPTPTTPVRDIGSRLDHITPSPAQSPSKPKPSRLHLPTIHLPASDDDEEEEVTNGNNEDYGLHFEVPERASATKDPNHSTCEIRIECDGSASGGGSETPPIETPKRGRNRRKSLVNLLFPKQGTNSTATTPTLEAPQGQRLHFRRVSEIFSRMGNMGKDEAQDSDGKRKQPYDDMDTPQSPPESCGLSIRHLFPYRRRRSSVSHLDNTDQFKESREEIIQSARRRMSSFPPMDGDEAAIMLEKAQVIRLEQAHQEALALQSSNAVTNAFRKLRRGSRSPSPMSLLMPGLSKNKKSKWKSSTDIPTSNTDSPGLKLGEFTFNNSQSNKSPNLTLPGFSNAQSDDFPSGTSVVSSVGDSQAFSAVSATSPSICDDTDSPRRPLFVFPKRKIEDVPGIYIPSGKPSKTKTTEDADIKSLSSNLLAVMQNKPRRHSMSDPIFLQNYAANNPRPILLPRSPYSTDSPCARYKPSGRHCIYIRSPNSLGWLITRLFVSDPMS